MDLCHAPLFALLAAFGCWCFRRAPAVKRSGLWVWLILMGFSLTSEALQSMVGRQSSWGDAFANLLGTTAGVLWMASPRKRLLARRILAVILFAVASLWPLAIVTDALCQQNELPMLASFESPLELSRWTFAECQFQRVQEHQTEGYWSLEVNLNVGTYPGLAMREVPPDWTPYAAFAFDVTLESPESLTLIVKITDKAHNWESDDRFHYHALLHSGLNQIRIPIRDIQRVPNGRFLNLKTMQMLQLFTVKPMAPARIVLDNIRLIPDQPAEEAVRADSNGFVVGMRVLE